MNINTYDYTRRCAQTHEGEALIHDEPPCLRDHVSEVLSQLNNIWVVNVIELHNDQD